MAVFCAGVPFTPSARLQQQFIRLWQCCEGKSQDTTLNQLAALLSCSRRHMRTLLNTMEDRGWLTGKRRSGVVNARVEVLYTGLALQQQRAEDLLEQIVSTRLVQLVGDKATVRQMLVSHLGRSFRQGGTSCACSTIVRCVICYLAAHCAVRNPSCRQIFSSLTRINEENGNWTRHRPPLGSKYHRFTGVSLCVQESIFIMVVNWKWTT
ncbi:SgrR family transcriptional regulator [Shigella flexneri]